MLERNLVMICGIGLDHLQSSGEYSCAVCRTGAGNNSIYCNGCKLWVHKKCSGLQWLTPNPDYRCAGGMGNARPIDSWPQSEVQVGPDKLEVPPGWHAFCWWRLWNNGHYSCENSLEEDQRATTSSQIRAPLLQDQRPCVQLLRADRHARESHRVCTKETDWERLPWVETHDSWPLRK